MARKVHVELVDDLDGSPADEAVSFGLDGKQYSIDLNSKHAEELRSTFAKYVAAGTAVTATSAPKLRGGAVKKQDGTASDARNWAKEQGIAVNDRGRVPNDLMVKFQAARIS